MPPVSLAHLRRVRWAVRAALTLGVAVSVAANILHANPNPISQSIAAWPPLALLITVELISRVPLDGRLLAAARLLAATTIAAIAAYVSYRHMAGVAAHYGETATSAHLLPLSVDGLIVVASLCLVELGGRLAGAATPTAHPMPAPAVTNHNPTSAPGAPPPDADTTPNMPAPPTAPIATQALPPAPRPPFDTLTGTSPITPTVDPASRIVAGPPSAYQPGSDEDAAMYQAWRRSVAAGREPSGVDLARAAGRSNDATGIGRRAARRYRDAQAEATRTASRPIPHPRAAAPSAGVTAASMDRHDDTVVPLPRNGHNPTPTAAAAP